MGSSPVADYHENFITVNLTYPYIHYNDLPSCDRRNRHADGRRPTGGG